MQLQYTKYDVYIINCAFSLPNSSLMAFPGVVDAYGPSP